MKTIRTEQITEAVSRLCQESNFFLNNDMISALWKAKDKEISKSGKNILQQIIENSDIAADKEIPLCQDTGFTVVFVEYGQEIRLEGGSLTDAINNGVRRGYTEGYLRKSIVGNPLSRINTQDNTPAVIHTEIVPGDKLKITVAPKGGGSENMSGLTMLKPAQGIEGVKDFVLNQVIKAGPNPCPPIVVGVGIGGTMEKCALLAKKALLRQIGVHNQDQRIAELEAELLKKINETGIGPQGLGGITTALAVNIEVFAAHIASLPVAVNINCHVNRHKTAVL